MRKVIPGARERTLAEAGQSAPLIRPGAKVNSFGNVIVDTAIGVVSEAIYVDVDISPFKGVSNTKAVRAAREAASAKGIRLSSKAADGIKKSNVTLNAEKAAANQAISKGLESAPSSVASKVIDKIQDKYRD